MMTSSAKTTAIPFRLRIGVVDDIPQSELDSLRGVLLPEVFNLLDSKSKQQLESAKHTEILLTFVPLTEANSISVDLFLTDGNASTSAKRILDGARQQNRPIITFAKTKLTVEKGHGLNAHAVYGIERFNAFSMSDAEQHSYVENLYNDLFSEKDGLPEDVKRLVRKQLIPFYVRASLLAKASQKIYRRAGLIVYSFSAIAVGAVAIGTLAPRFSSLAFGLELLLLLTILGVILHANSKRSHKNWIEARYVTERIRAAIFLTTCGVKTSTMVQPSNVGLTGKPDEWMIMTFNEIVARLPEFEECHRQTVEPFLSFVRRQWISVQIDFHTRKATAAKRKNHLFELMGFVLFAAAILAAASHLLLHSLHLELLEHPLTFLAIFLPAAGAALGGIRAHREYSRLAARSNNMALSLQVLDAQLAQVTKPRELAAILARVEELSLLELQDWLMLMSVAKLEASA
jgi:hypothetical protein